MQEYLVQGSLELARSSVPRIEVELYNAARERRSDLLARLKRLWARLVRTPAYGTSEA